MKDDFSFGWEYRARATELQDIAAMDRLAAQSAPASALRRYAAARADRGTEHGIGGWWHRLTSHAGHHAGAGARP